MVDREFDVFTFGETMLRLSPPANIRLEQTVIFDVAVAGTESNVACNLARLGNHVAWYSHVADSPLGRMVERVICSYGVNIDEITRTPDYRQGTYYVELGEAPRGVQVYYDRSNSAATQITPEHLPLDHISASRWMHLTGITPALSENCHATVVRAIDHAQEHDLTISFDVNYRHKLWSPEKAVAILTPFCQRADYIFLSKRDAHLLWGVEGSSETLAQIFHERWHNTVIITDGADGVTGCDSDGISQTSSFETTIIDRIGAGDALASGIIDRLLEDASLEDALQFGSAMAALKLSITGDIALVTREEVYNLINGNINGLKR